MIEQWKEATIRGFMDKYLEDRSMDKCLEDRSLLATEDYTSHSLTRCFKAPSVDIEVPKLKYELPKLLS